MLLYLKTNLVIKGMRNQIDIPLYLVGIFVSTAFLLLSCNTTDPPPPGNSDKPELLLKLEDASCTEAWITLTTNNLQLPAAIELKQNDQTRLSINLTTADTLLYIDSLLPNQTYKLRAIVHPSNQASEVLSNEISVATMDTTSHNFTFETFTFGEHSSSTLYDVAIIDENNIWAVGEIYMKDSLGQPDPKFYNAAHWDGVNWELKRIYYDGGVWIIRTVFAFSANNIWFSAFVRYDGHSFIEIPIPPVLMGWTVNKIWGSSSNDIYAVGNGGNIVRYNGSWQKLESGTDVNLTDVYGTPDGEVVWIAGYEDFKPTVLLKINNNTIQTIFNSRDYLFVFDPEHISGGIAGIWTNSKNYIYVTTWYSLYRKSFYNGFSKEEALIPSNPQTFFGLKSRGTDINNIFTIGSRYNIHHYNGNTFKSFKFPADESVTYIGLDVEKNITVLCGRKYENGISDKAIITIINK